MKRKTMTTYRTALGFLQSPILWLSRRRKRDPKKIFRVKRPAGSVAPIY
jgi:hypothetical protein